MISKDKGNRYNTLHIITIYKRQFWVLLQYDIMSRETKWGVNVANRVTYNNTGRKNVLIHSYQVYWIQYIQANEYLALSVPSFRFCGFLWLYMLDSIKLLYMVLSSGCESNFFSPESSKWRKIYIAACSQGFPLDRNTVFIRV